MVEYTFLNSLMLRTPFFSSAVYKLNEVSVVLKDTAFRNALYLANPVLHKILEAKEFKWNLLNSKEQLTVSRYYNRICFRPTPFGTFSSFSITNWGEDGLIQLDDNTLHLQLDQAVSGEFAARIIKHNINDQKFQPNPTLYRVGKEFRFIKTIQSDADPKFTFSLESFEYNILSSSILYHCKENNITGREIILYIQKLSECTAEEAVSYFEFLIHAQIIRSIFDCNIVGEDYLKRLINEPVLTQAPLSQEVKDFYADLDYFTLTTSDKLLALQDRVNHILRNTEALSKSQVFYAGLERRVNTGSLPLRYQKAIGDGLDALQLLVPSSPNPVLQQFIKDFKSRYDKQKISLLTVLDPEIGLGYSNLIDQAEAPLLKEIKFKQAQDESQSISWTKVHRLLFERWQNGPNQKSPINLTQEDLLALDNTELQLNLAPSFPVMFRVIGEHVFIELAGGVSANALLGRFTAWSPSFKLVCERIAEHEQSNNPDVVFAEIGQLSDAHADNINRREHIYAYEIPINVSSTLPTANQIALSDLYISANNDQLVLESASLKKTIIPRLSSAYNFSRNQLLIFRFLCDLQYQGVRNNLILDLEHLFPGLSFYPRLTFKNTILCLAKWHLSKDDIRRLTENKKEKSIDEFDMLRSRLGLPLRIALTRSDQQLVFNLKKAEEVSLFIDCIKGLDKVQLQEFLIPENNVVTGNDGQPFINQFIACLVNTKAVYTTAALATVSGRVKAKREHIIGSEWIYLKIYCHSSVSNNLLAKKILPLLQELNREKDKVQIWFFVRYIDAGGHHIRLRLKITETLVGNVLNRFKRRLGSTVKYQLIREYQADTYRPELERYGDDIIRQVETLFHTSSELVLNFIRRSLTKTFRFSYHSLAFVCVNSLVERFLPLLRDQIAFLGRVAGNFYNEFLGDKSLRVDLDLKYRELKQEMKTLFIEPEYYKKLKLTEFEMNFNQQVDHIQKATDKFTEQRRTQLLADLIHMHLNRLFTEEQRKQEMIIYYCLHKFKLSIQAINKKAVS